MTTEQQGVAEDNSIYTQILVGANILTGIGVGVYAAIDVINDKVSPDTAAKVALSVGVLAISLLGNRALSR